MKNLIPAATHKIALGSLVAVSMLSSAQVVDAQPRWGRPQAPNSGACFYQEPNFQGGYFCARVGEDISTLNRTMRGRISSIRIFGDAEVSAYQADRFGGRSAQFEGDVRDLRYEGWNSRFSSFQIRNSYGDGRRDNRGWTDSRRPGDDYDRGRPGYSGGQGGYDPNRPDARGGYNNGNNNDGRGNDGRLSSSDADAIVRRVYRDVLSRDPDAPGLALYRGRMLNEGWKESDVREALLKSPEYRDRNTERNTMTPQQAQEIVARAYRAILKREPDPASQGFVDKVLKEHWTEEDVSRELRNSAEYRNKDR